MTTTEAPREGTIFTPFVKRGTYPGDHLEDGRAAMWLSPEDEAQWDRLGPRASVVVTDQNTQTKWLVRRADCGAGCRCAAQADPIKDPTVGHIAKVCEEAGLGVMVQVYGIIRDREEATDDQLLALTAEKVEVHYNGWIARAIDRLTDDEFYVDEEDDDEE